MCMLLSLLIIVCDMLRQDDVRIIRILIRDGGRNYLPAIVSSQFCCNDRPTIERAATGAVMFVSDCRWLV